MLELSNNNSLLVDAQRKILTERERAEEKKEQNEKTGNEEKEEEKRASIDATPTRVSTPLRPNDNAPLDDAAPAQKRQQQPDENGVRELAGRLSSLTGISPTTTAGNTTKSVLLASSSTTSHDSKGQHAVRFHISVTDVDENVSVKTTGISFGARNSSTRRFSEHARTPQKQKKRLQSENSFGSMADGACASTTAQESADDVPAAFLRTDSIIIRVKPGQSFSEYSNVVVDSPARCDPRLGTLGELRHHLRTGTKSQVKKFLRHNHWSSGHRIRAELWKELCRDKNADAQRAVYRDIVDKLRNIRSGPSFLDAPGVVICDHHLKETGKECLMRLLTAIEHQRPDFTYVPVLYPLAALFLHYMTDEDAFVCIMQLLSHSQKFLIQTDIATAASKRTMVVLVKKHVNRAYVLLRKLIGAQDDKELVPIFDEWKSWVFRDLPFSHLVRVVDCFLFEGQKVLFRVALAVVHLWYKDKYKELRSKTNCTIREVANDIAEYIKTIKIQPHKLLKAAFGIRNLKMSTIIRLQNKHELNLRNCSSALAEFASQQNLKQVSAQHNFIDIKVNSSMLSNNEAMTLISWLPPRCQLLKPTRLFWTEEDGTSFTRLWSKIENYCPTILLIRTSDNEIFGAFCSTEWEARKRNATISYFGTGETFIFRFTPKAEKFSWVGCVKSNVNHSEELIMAADMNTLIIGGGGGEAISIRQSLESGSSGHCDTFDNPPLSANREFQIQSLEFFGLLAED